MEVLENQTCPFCHKNTLTLQEAQKDVPYFGVCYIFSMDCSNCHYHKADIEAEEERNPIKSTLEISEEEDMKIRIIKSSNATIKIPRITTVEPGEASNGYITNVEGILNRIKRQIEFARDNSDDKAERTKAKNMVKKLQRVMWGQDKISLTIEDPTGNSAIISEKAVTKKL